MFAEIVRSCFAQRLQFFRNVGVFVFCMLLVVFHGVRTVDFRFVFCALYVFVPFCMIIFFFSGSVFLRFKDGAM